MRAAKASVLERLRTYENPLPHGVMDFLRFRTDPWGGAMDFSDNLGLGSGGLLEAILSAAEASISGMLCAY